MMASEENTPKTYCKQQIISDLTILPTAIQSHQSVKKIVFIKKKNKKQGLPFGRFRNKEVKMIKYTNEEFRTEF